MSKAKKGKDDGGENNDAKIQMLEFRVKQLQMKIEIVDEQERADRARASEKQLHTEMLAIDGDFKTEKDKLFNTSNDMNRQYKQMQDELLKDINELKKTVVEKDDIIKGKETSINDLVRDYELKIKKKDQDITDLKRKIEDMSNEFASMLRETLDKMQERIEIAQWDSDSDPQIMKRLKDIAGMQQ